MKGEEKPFEKEKKGRRVKVSEGLEEERRGMDVNRKQIKKGQEEDSESKPNVIVLIIHGY